ncbi:MAG TPA: hypothetical protein VFR67_07615 [Pilimelia sp.]|nr:hypothetical protein [Pilimelia sp.]
MDRLAELKGALYPTDGPSDELRARALASFAGGGAAPRSARRRWVGPALGATAVAVVAAGAVLLMSDPGGTRDSGNGGDGRDGPVAGPVAVQPAAFAVRVNADGSVTFTAHDVIDIAAATRALNDAGIAGRVINDITAGCPTKADDIAPQDLYPDNTLSRGLGTSDTVTFRSSDYPAGGGLLVVVTSRGEDTGRPVPPDPVSVAIFAFDNAGKIPTCVDFADPGTG